MQIFQYKFVERLVSLYFNSIKNSRFHAVSECQYEEVGVNTLFYNHVFFPPVDLADLSNSTFPWAADTLLKIK